MDALEKIRNTMRSYKGRMKKLENDRDVDLETYCDRCSALEHEFFEVVERILENDEKAGKTEMSSVQIAKFYCT